MEFLTVLVQKTSVVVHTAPEQAREACAALCTLAACPRTCGVTARRTAQMEVMKLDAVCSLKLPIHDLSLYILQIQVFK